MTEQYVLFPPTPDWVGVDIASPVERELARQAGVYGLIILTHSQALLRKRRLDPELYLTCSFVKDDASHAFFLDDPNLINTGSLDQVSVSILSQIATHLAADDKKTHWRCGTFVRAADRRDPNGAYDAMIYRSAGQPGEVGS